jgi:hypothetical protein
MKIECKTMNEALDLKEVTSLKRLKHPYIVKLMEAAIE